MPDVPKILDAAGEPMVRPAPGGRMTIGASAAHNAASVELPELQNWRPFRGSPAADLLGELDTIVSRSRDLIRNHGIASGAVQTFLDNIIGGGLRLKAKPDWLALGFDRDWAEEWSDLVNAKFRAWSESNEPDVTGQANLGGLTGQMFRSVLGNGEAVGLPLWLPRYSGRYATHIQLVESDRLSQPAGYPESPAFRAGIEFNTYGRPDAYHISKSHPGDVLWGGAIIPQEWERIPAMTPRGRRRVLHVFDKERPDQPRGKPLLTPIMEQIKKLDHYERTELRAAIVNSLIAAFIETPLAGEDIASLFAGGDYIEKKKAWETSKLAGGAIIPLFPGDKLSSFLPNRPGDAFGIFTDRVLDHIATGLNIPKQLLTKNFENMNYSSARTALLEAWRFFSQRRDWIGAAWMRPIYELWLEEAIAQGEVEAPGFYENRAAYTRCRWIGPPRGWIDPVKEAQGMAWRLHLGVSTLEDEAAEAGKEWDDVLEQRAREMSYARTLGVPDPVAPGPLPRGESRDPDEGDDA